jgi:hypothetical protein
MGKQIEQPVFGEKIRPSISRIRGRNINKWNTGFQYLKASYFSDTVCTSFQFLFSNIRDLHGNTYIIHLPVSLCLCLIWPQFSERSIQRHGSDLCIGGEANIPKFLKVDSNYLTSSFESYQWSPHPAIFSTIHAGIWTQNKYFCTAIYLRGVIKKIRWMDVPKEIITLISKCS